MKSWINKNGVRNGTELSCVCFVSSLRGGQTRKKALCPPRKLGL